MVAKNIAELQKWLITLLPNLDILRAKTRSSISEYHAVEPVKGYCPPVPDFLHKYFYISPAFATCFAV